MIVNETATRSRALDEHSRAKMGRHDLVTRLSYLQQQVTNGTIRFREIGTKDQISDIMTKALPEQAFLKLSHALVHNLSDLYPERTNQH